MSVEGYAWILVPTTIDTGQLSSSSIPDPDTGEVAWNAATAYNKDDKAFLASNHTIYTRRVAGTTAGSPDVDTANWAASGRQNRWAMFDNTSGTVSTHASSLSVVLTPGRIGGLFADGLVGSSITVSMKNQVGGTVVYGPVTISLDDTIITDVYDWFFAEREQRPSVVLVDLPTQFLNPELTVTISSGAGNCECDSLRVGLVYNIGATLVGATVQAINYSTVTTDTYGVTSITARGFLKLLNCQVKSDRDKFKRIFRLLTTLKDTLAVYIASSADDDLAPLTVQGIPYDWSIAAEDGDLLQCNFQAKGISLT